MLLAAPLLLFLLFCLLIPTLTLLARGINLQILSQPFILERLTMTLLQASLSSLMVLILALFFGGFLARFSFKGKAWLEATLSLPFVVPVLVASLGFLGLFGSRGWFLNLEGTLWLVLLANIFYNLGLAIRFVMTALGSQSLELEFVARLEGASTWQVWRFVTLPMALPSAFIGAGFTFLYTFASFGVPLLLGGAAFATLEVEMYLSVQRLELESAAGLALLQFLVTFSAAWLITLFERRNSQSQSFDLYRPKATGWTRVGLYLSITFLLLLTFAPLLTVAIKSFSSPTGFTLRHYQQLFTVSSSVFQADLGTAIWNNLRFAGMALLVAVPLGISYALAVWRSKNSFLDALSLLPLAISSTLLGVAYIVTYPSLTASLPLLIAVYALTAYPLMTRATLGALRQLEPDMLQAARLDGANEWQEFRFIILPLIEPAVKSGIALTFAVVIGEFAATLMLSRPEWATLTTLIYQRLARPNQIGEASALAMILLLLSLSGFLLLGWNWSSKPSTQK
jgi:thiamine transport system permease protein